MARPSKKGGKRGAAKTRKAKRRKPAKTKPPVRPATRLKRLTVSGRALKEAREQQAATADILKVISRSAFDLQAVLEALVKSAVQLCDADTGIIRRREGDLYPVAATFGFSEQERDYFSHYSVKPDRGSVFGRAILEKRSVHVPDLMADRGLNQERLKDYAKDVKIRSGLGVPLLREGTTIGVFTLQRRKRKPYTKKQIELVETFANQAIIAIENTRLFEEVQAKTRDLSESLRQQTATADVLKVISRSAFDLNSVLSTLVASAARLCEAERGLIFLRKGDFFHTSANFGFSPELEAFARANPLPADGKSTTARAGASGSPIQAVDLLADETQGHLAREYQRLGGHRTNLGVPLRRDGETIGVFTLTRQLVMEFTPRQIELVQTFADQAVIAIENARLFNETQEALERQTATADILKVIASSPSDVQPVFDAIAESAKRLLGSHTAVVTRVIDDVVHLAASTAENEAAAHAERGLLPYALSSDRIHAKVARNGQLVATADVDAATHLPQEVKDFAMTVGWRGILVVPMLRNNVAIGTIGITRREPGSFNDKTVDLLKTFADQAVIAIENARLFNETKEALERQTATTEVLEVINSSPGNLAPVFDAMLEKAIRLCDAISGHFRTYDGNSFPLAAVRGEAEHVQAMQKRGPLVPGPHHPVSRFLRGDNIVHLPNAKESEAYRADDSFRSLVDRGALSVLSVALRKDGLLLGYINVYRHVAQPFTERQIALLQNFSSQAVIAMENARLITQTREALEQQTATADVLKVISRSAFDLQMVLDTLTESASELCNAHMGSIARKDDRGYYHATAYKFAVDWVTVADPLRLQPGRDSVVGRALLEKKAVQIVDVLADPEYNYPDMQKTAGYRTLLGVPLMRQGDPIGVLFLGRRTVEPFTEKQIELVSTFADQAVIAIENVRLFDETQEALARQTATSDVLKVIASSPSNLQPVFDSIAERSKTLIGAHSTVVVRYLDGMMELAAFTPVNPEADALLQAVFPRPPTTLDPQTEKVLRGDVAQIFDAQSELQDNVMQDAARARGWRSRLLVPLKDDTGVIGWISVTRKEAGGFADKDVELLQTFADQAVIAIKNVELLEKVQERTRELTQSLDDLRAAQDRLVQTEKLASLGQLTAGIAHEIKNPLNFINNFSALSAELVDEMTDVFQNPELDEASRRKELDEIRELLKSNLEKVVQHGKRADSIVKNMLLHSREGSSERRSAEVNRLVEESLSLAYHGARAEKAGFTITLKHDLDPEAGALDLYPQEMTRALLNLISNGFYAATKRKTEASDESFEPVLSAVTRNLGRTIEIRIRDNGMGIPPEIREKMFNPFFTTKPTGEGTGLGLSMTHDIIVKQHGGKIDVETEPGAFTEFIITLPRGNGNAGGRKSE